MAVNFGTGGCFLVLIWDNNPWGHKPFWSTTLVVGTSRVKISKTDQFYWKKIVGNFERWTFPRGFIEWYNSFSWIPWFLEVYHPSDSSSPSPHQSTTPRKYPFPQDNFIEDPLIVSLEGLSPSLWHTLPAPAPDIQRHTGLHSSTTLRVFRWARYTYLELKSPPPPLA